ncbi:hypothetical protein NIIDMKKI_15990 [Mycobacterium kansasii]|uniref:Uncharacterized protein n=1 Tax=Mycobacterium kansasii TaxID=1768 RepID=A0A7G1I7V2_MYCKA|nr:hypothetical protein NIIDMKKI_15990 [Mycobacterium kansasii]
MVFGRNGVEADQRGVPVAGQPEFARDGGDFERFTIGQAEQLLYPPRVRGGPGSQPRHDPSGQHRSALQNLFGIVGQRLRALLNPDHAGEHR